MNEEMIDVVDENDKVIDVKPRSEIKNKAILHRGAHTFVLNSKKEIFVHQRASKKKDEPLLWAMFTGGFVSSGEEYEEAALRELEEEIGIKADRLEFIGDYRYKVETDDWFGKLYRYVSDEEIRLQEEEIEQGFFIPLEELGKFVQEHEMKDSDLFTYKKFKDMIK